MFNVKMWGPNHYKAFLLSTGKAVADGTSIEDAKANARKALGIEESPKKAKPAKKKGSGNVCEYCGFEAKSARGLSVHINAKH